MNEDNIYEWNWGDYTITSTNPQGTTALSYFVPENNYNITTVKYDFTNDAISVQDDIKNMKRHMSDMQTEINNLRAENQMLRNSLKTYIKEMKEMINKKN